MPTIAHTYNEWRFALKSPNDSIFYYHPGLECILLGLSIFAIASRPLIRTLGKLKSLTVMHIYIKDLVTAWIDDDEESFKIMFGLTMTLAEAYTIAIIGAEKQHPSKKKILRKLAALYGSAVASGGDMAPTLAETLLDDLSTDGDHLYSDKIERFGEELLNLVNLHGMDIPPYDMNCLIGRSRF